VKERGFLYKLARIMGDVNAVKRGRVGRRVARVSLPPSRFGSLEEKRRALINELLGRSLGRSLSVTAPSGPLRCDAALRVSSSSESAYSAPFPRACPVAAWCRGRLSPVSTVPQRSQVTANGPSYPQAPSKPPSPTAHPSAEFLPNRTGRGGG